MSRKLKQLLNSELKKLGTTTIELGTWDGGNDSGYFSFHGFVSECEEDLVELCEAELGYGSWAGSYQSTGTVYYNRNGKITLEESYSDDETVPWRTETFTHQMKNIGIKRPKITFAFNGSDGVDVKVGVLHGTHPEGQDIGISNALAAWVNDHMQKLAQECLDETNEEMSDPYGEVIVEPVKGLVNFTMQLDRRIATEHRHYTINLNEPDEDN